MNTILSNDWQEILDHEFKKDYFQALERFLQQEYATKLIFPPKEDIFNAFRLTPYYQVKVVILGQDPYHDDFQAHGLCFSVRRGIKLPPSLRNIFKELKADYSYEIPSHGNLESWSKQGVLLMNTVMTVRAHEAASHSKKGWEIFTDQVIIELNKRDKPIIFVLWGNYARSKKTLITQAQHKVIESAHPSPLSASRGFFGSRPFSTINSVLSNWGEEEINWKIEN